MFLFSVFRGHFSCRKNTPTSTQKIRPSGRKLDSDGMLAILNFVDKTTAKNTSEKRGKTDNLKTVEKPGNVIV